MRQYAIGYSEQAKKYGFSAENVVKVEPIGAKQAWILTDKDGNKWLQSYNTIVSGCIDGGVIHFGKWSSTTSRHQSKFAQIVAW